jgi:hypothetical protein
MPDQLGERGGQITLVDAAETGKATHAAGQDLIPDAGYGHPSARFRKASSPLSRRVRFQVQSARSAGDR